MDESSMEGGSETVVGHSEQYEERCGITATGYLDVDLKNLKKERLMLYLEAEKAILAGAQSYTLDNRTLTRANLSEIRKAISDLIAEIALEESLKYGNSRRVMFID